MAGGRTAAVQAEAGAIAATPPPFASAEAVKLWLSERFARESDPERILRTAAATIGEFLGAARVGYGEFEADATRIAIPLDWARAGLASIAGVHAFDPDSEIGRRCAAGTSVVIDDIADAPRIRDRAGPLAVGTSRAFIAVPLINDGRLVAVFVATDDSPRRWTQDEITLVSQTGARIWGALQHLRLTEQLRESEEQFRMMAENLPGICWVGDRDAKPLWGNTRWHTMYDETAAAHGDARAAIHPDDLPRAKAIWKDMRANGAPGEFQLRLRGADGIFRPFLSKASPIHDAAGAVTRWVGVQIDLSDQLAQNRRQLVLRSFYDATLALSDPAAILAAMSRLVVAHLDVPYFLYFEATAPRAQLSILESGEGAPFAGPDRAALDAAFQALANRPGWTETRVIDDERDIERAPDDPISIIGRLMSVRAGVNVPIVKNGRRVAAMTVLDVKPRHWTPDEVGLIEDLSEALWATIARARAEAELKERQRSQAFLIEWTDRTRELTSGDAIIAVTMELLAAQLQVARATYSVADDSGRLFAIRGEWRDPRVPSIAATSFSLDDVGATVEREWVTGETVCYADIATDPRIEETVRDAYFQTAIHAFVSVPLIENERVRSALSVQHDAARVWTAGELQLLRDIADRIWVAIERARAETELQERERDQAFLIGWTDRLRGLTDPDAITGVTLELLGKFLSVARTTYAIGDAAGVTFTICGEWRDHGPSIAGETFTFEQTGPSLTQEWHSGEIIHSHDVEHDPAVAPAMLAPYRETGIRAFVSVPLLEGGRIRSSLSVQHDAPRAWSPGELNLLREVAERTWIALERARAEIELKERERSQAFLIEWTDALRGERAPDRIVAVTLARLGRHFGINRTTYSLGDETGNLLTNRGEWADGVISVADTVWRLDDVDPEVRRQWLTGEPIHYDDIPHDPRITPARRAFFEQVSVRSLVTIPLIENGLVRSALSLQSKVERRWTEGEIQLLRDVAERTWVVLERARAEAELATRERNQAFLIDWSDQIRGEAEPDRIIAATLAALGPFLGVSRATFAALDPAEDATFEVSSEWRDGVDSLLGNRFTLPSVGAAVDRDWHAGESIRFDDVAADPRLEPAAAERYRTHEIAAFLSVPLVAGGAMQSALSVQSARPRVWTDGEVQLLRDVAERTWAALERAEAQAVLAERSRHQAFLVAWNDMVRGEARARVILAQTVRMLGEHLGVTCVNYSEPDARMTQMTVIEEYHAPDAIGVKGTTYPMTYFGEAFAAAQRSGAPARVDDIATDDRFDNANRESFAAIGVGAILTLPMKRGPEVLAILSAQHRDRRNWTDAEVELARDLADRTLSVLERAQSEARLAESEAQLSAILEHAPIAMNLRDAQGRYIRLNPEFGRAVHRPVEELTGLTPGDIFPPHVADQIMAMHARAMAGEVASLELMEGEGKYESVLTIAFPIGDGQGAAKTAGFTIDLSERKKAELALQKSRDTLYQTEKLTALGSLLAGVSHELNNPLSIVVAQAVMMERQSQGSELAERAQKIRKAADRCARIVQSFLAMARQKRPEREAVDLNAIAGAAHELADYGLKNDGIATLRALAPNLPPISADSDQLHQIVINLIVNAQQAMVEGGANERVLTLRSGPGERPGTVMLEVADTGPGIPMEVQRRIFEPFYTTKPQGQGTGVGLSFSQGLAEAHGGTLELVPAKIGACFRLTLPIDDAAAVPVATAEAELASPVPARRALVIDDEREIAESLADFLSLEGFRCEVAAGGIAARHLLDDGDFDLIVSDLRMPDLDGPSLYAWMTDHRPDLADRIAFATGDTLGQTAARFLTELKRPVLEKPFTPEAVRRFLEQMDLA